MQIDFRKIHHIAADTHHQLLEERKSKEFGLQLEVIDSTKKNNLKVIIHIKHRMLCGPIALSIGNNLVDEINLKTLTHIETFGEDCKV